MDQVTLGDDVGGIWGVVGVRLVEDWGTIEIWNDEGVSHGSPIVPRCGGPGAQGSEAAGSTIRRFTALSRRSTGRSARALTGVAFLGPMTAKVDPVPATRG